LDRPRIRLVGVKAEGFRDAADVPEQLTLDALITAPDRSASERALDAARAKFGTGAIGYGSLMPVPPRSTSPDAQNGGDPAGARKS
jgi:DNA polymerase-4